MNEREKSGGSEMLTASGIKGGGVKHIVQPHVTGIKDFGEFVIRRIIYNFFFVQRKTLTTISKLPVKLNFEGWEHRSEENHEGNFYFCNIWLLMAFYKKKIPETYGLVFSTPRFFLPLSRI